MRSTFKLNKPVPPRQVMHKRYFVDGKKLNTKRMIDTLEKDGHKITVKNLPTIAPAKKFKGICIGNMLWGMIVWAKKDEETYKLMKKLQDGGFFMGVCTNMPVEKKSEHE